MSQAQLNLETVVRRSDALLFNNLGNEVVMMDIEHGTYYGLEKVAARIWSLTEEPASVGALCHRLTAEYDVPVDKCQQEVIAFLDQLRDCGIVRVI